MTILNANGKILKANGKVLVNGGSDTVVIGSRSYPYKRFGNLFWLTDNFKEEAGITRPPAGNSDNVETYGLLYRLNSVLSLPNKQLTTAFQNLIPPGWRIPTERDIKDLFDSVGGQSVAHIELAKEEVGFNLTYPGMYNNGYSNLGSGLYMIMTGVVPSYFYQNYGIQTFRIFYQSFSGDSYLSIRLVKDA